MPPFLFDYLHVIDPRTVDCLIGLNDANFL